MKTLLALLLLILPTAVFGGTWIEERDKYDSSQTVILESNKDYVILENKSALIEAPLHRDYELNIFTMEKTPREGDNPIRFNQKFGDDAAEECERQGWALHSWFKSTDEFVNTDYLEVLSKHRGKFLCLPQKTKYTLAINHYLGLQSKFCTETNTDVGWKIQCVNIDGYIKDYTHILNQLGVDIVAENEKSLIAQKQKKCETLGFEMGTEKNGDCVLKLMELDKQ